MLGTALTFSHQGCSAFVAELPSQASSLGSVVAEVSIDNLRIDNVRVDTFHPRSPALAHLSPTLPRNLDGMSTARSRRHGIRSCVAACW